MLHTAHSKYRRQKVAKKSSSGHHRTTLLASVFTTKAYIDNRKKNLLNSNICSTYPHNMVNFDPLATEIGWRVWDTPANFNGFHVLDSLLRGRHSTEANQTLYDVWPAPRLVHCVFIFRSSCPLTNFAWCKVHLASESCILLYRPQYCTALQQQASAKICGVVQGVELCNFRRGRHLYSPGRPSRWASVHILVVTSMWANAQRDGCPAKYRRRPLQKLRNSIPCTMPQSLAEARCWSAMQ